MYELEFGKQWYALRVKSRHEKSVTHLLMSQSFEVFLPVYRARRRWADRAKTVEFPLFAGYTFCYFDTTERLAVRDIPGVVDIVRNGAVPAAIDSEEISNIRRAVDSRLALEVLPGLVVGQRVRMVAGPLAGLEGALVKVARGPRLVMSVTLLQQSVFAEIDAGWVVPVQNCSK
jgi:transcription antitermination factor NusG